MLNGNCIICNWLIHDDICDKFIGLLPSHVIKLNNKKIYSTNYFNDSVLTYST